MQLNSKQNLRLVDGNNLTFPAQPVMRLLFTDLKVYSTFQKLQNQKVREPREVFAGVFYQKIDHLSLKSTNLIIRFCSLWISSNHFDLFLSHLCRNFVYIAKTVIHSFTGTLIHGFQLFWKVLRKFLIIFILENNSEILFHDFWEKLILVYFGSEITIFLPCL